MTGKLHDSHAEFICNRVTKWQIDGKVYECASTFSTGLPIIRSVGTGKYFTLSWDDIIQMARAKGIDL